MFDDQKTTPANSDKPAAPQSVVAGSDIVIHSMPKEFYDREVKLKEEPKPQPKAVVPPPPPAPLPVPPVAQPKPPAPLPRRGSKLWIVVVILIIIILGFGGTAGYLYYQGFFTSPVIAPEPDPTPTPTPTPTPEPSKPVSGADTDSDGLSNVEELLYGTDFRNPDSDGDTFLDGNEVFHRFDPRGLAPSTLLDTGAVRVLENAELPFSMYYPTPWNPISTPASQRVSFRSATGAAVNVLWQDKAQELALDAWYDAQVGEVPMSRLQPTVTKEGYEALIGPDERVMYVNAGNRVYTLIYDLGDAKSIEFLQTFKMMANSFKLVP